MSKKLTPIANPFMGRITNCGKDDEFWSYINVSDGKKKKPCKFIYDKSIDDSNFTFTDIVRVYGELTIDYPVYSNGLKHGRYRRKILSIKTNND